MTGKKRKIIIPILAIITILFILDRIVIIRIKYDEGMYDGHSIDFPENMAVSIYKGYGRDSEPYPCFGYKKNMSDGPLYIGLNLFSLNGIGINGKEAYLINDICYVDGKQIYIYYDLSYPDYKVHFWKIIIKTHFH